jgi:hypothetical protein
LIRVKHGHTSTLHCGFQIKDFRSKESEPE